MRRPNIDRTGHQYNYWTVLGLDKESSRSLPSGKGVYYWHCRCVCGNKRTVSSFMLQQGQSESCGCMKAKTDRPASNRIDMTGQVFGELTVLRQDRHAKLHDTAWECLCSCGNKAVIERRYLVGGSQISCGCVKPDVAEKIRNSVQTYMVGKTYVPGIMNRKLSSSNKSGIKGVYFDKAKGKWVGYITFEGKTTYKRFNTKQEAADYRAKMAMSAT